MHLPVIGQKRLSLEPLMGQHQADNILVHPGHIGQIRLLFLSDRSDDN